MEERSDGAASRRAACGAAGAAREPAARARHEGPASLLASAQRCSGAELARAQRRAWTRTSRTSARQRSQASARPVGPASVRWCRLDGRKATVHRRDCAARIAQRATTWSVTQPLMRRGADNGFAASLGLTPARKAGGCCTPRTPSFWVGLCSTGHGPCVVRTTGGAGVVAPDRGLALSHASPRGADASGTPAAAPGSIAAPRDAAEQLAALVAARRGSDGLNGRGSRRRRRPGAPRRAPPARDGPDGRRGQRRARWRKERLGSPLRPSGGFSRGPSPPERQEAPTALCGPGNALCGRGGHGRRGSRRGSAPNLRAKGPERYLQ